MANELKHTLGPWTLPKFGGWEKELEIPEPQVWVDYDDVDREEAEANARLVTAAPQLLAALEMLYDKYENGDPCYGDVETLSDFMGNAVSLSHEEENSILAAFEKAGLKTALSSTFTEASQS